MVETKQIDIPQEEQPNLFEAAQQLEALALQHDMPPIRQVSELVLTSTTLFQRIYRDGV